MRLEMIGLNHTTSSLAVRDKAAIAPERFEEALRSCGACPGVEGLVIISTCNRVEVYISPVHHIPADRMRQQFAEVTGLSTEEAAACYIFRDDQAVQHLFDVAAGLDSQLIGEMQILAQVKDAYQKALDFGVTNSILNKTFTRAIECGKDVRHRTGISRGSVSVAYAATELATRVFGSLANSRVLVIGAGETSTLATRYLRDEGVTHWQVSNRTTRNAEILAQELGGDVAPFPPDREKLAWADVVVSATSSPEPVVRYDDVRNARRKSSNPLLFLDLAVPRDIDERVRTLPNTYHYTVDDFNEMVEANLKARKKEAVRAEKVVSRHVEEFVEWYQENRVAPALKQLQQVLEEIRSHEFERNAKRFSEADQKQLDKFSRALMKKVSALFAENIKRASLEKDDLTLARAVTLALSPRDGHNVDEILEKLDHELSHTPTSSATSQQHSAKTGT